MGRREFIGLAEYDNDGNDHYYQWARVDGLDLYEMLDQVFGDTTWRWRRDPPTVRVVIEVLEAEGEVE